jgi:hypothetical protein
METVRIRDPGWKKSRIRDKHPGSATLVGSAFCKDLDKKENLTSSVADPNRIRRIHLFLGFLDPEPDSLVRGMVPDPDPARTGAMSDHSFIHSTFWNGNEYQMLWCGAV